MWRSAYFATSIAIGVPRAEALAGLVEPGGARDLARALEARDRPARAEALARALAHVGRAVDEVTLA